MKKLLFANKHSFTKEQFESLNDIDGLEVLYLDGPETQKYDMDFNDINGVVCFKFFDYNPIEQFKNLEFVHTTSTGTDQMPHKYLQENNITLKNCPGVHSIPISEFVLGSVLQIYKKSHKLKAQQREHKWECDWNLVELYKKRVLILGTGSIGSHCAKRFKAFDTNVIGVDPFPKNDGSFDEIYTMDKMDEELAKADVVVNCIPLFDNTYHLIDKHCFDLMKDEAVFVNITRGPVVDTEALLDTLENGKLMGAAVDVFEQEPLPADSRLWDIDRLLISAHNSFAGEGNAERIFGCIYSDIKDWVAASK